MKIFENLVTSLMKLKSITKADAERLARYHVMRDFPYEWKRAQEEKKANG